MAAGIPYLVAIFFVKMYCILRYIGYIIRVVENNTPNREDQMVITKKYAQELIKQGRATAETRLSPDACGAVYVAVTRHDIQRTDHYIDN